MTPVREYLSLLAIEPARDGEEQQLKGRYIDHERELIPQTASGSWILRWDTTR
jgi:hypothetical protein